MIQVSNEKNFRGKKILNVIVSVISILFFFSVNHKNIRIKIILKITFKIFFF